VERHKLTSGKIKTINLGRTLEKKYACSIWSLAELKYLTA
jgi:hypothetical protein